MKKKVYPSRQLRQYKWSRFQKSNRLESLNQLWQQARILGCQLTTKETSLRLCLQLPLDKKLQVLTKEIMNPQNKK